MDFESKTVNEIKEAQNNINSSHSVVFLLTRIRTLAFEFKNSKQGTKKNYPNIDFISNWAIHGRLDKNLKKRFKVILKNLAKGHYSFQSFFKEIDILYSEYDIEVLKNDEKHNLVQHLSNTIYEIEFDFANNISSDDHKDVRYQFILRANNQPNYELKAEVSVEPLRLGIKSPQISASDK